MGATLEVAGATLYIPPGALPGEEPVEVTLRRMDVPAPAGFDGLSPVYAVDPEGLALLLPATLEIKFSGNPSKPMLVCACGNISRGA